MTSCMEAGVLLILRVSLFHDRQDGRGMLDERVHLLYPLHFPHLCGCFMYERRPTSANTGSLQALHLQLPVLLVA